MSEKRKKIYPERVNFRLTKSERKKLKEDSKKSGLSESQYLRNLILDSKVWNPSGEMIQELRRMINEINKIGVNINQITHNNNSELYYESDKKFLEVLLYKQQEIMLEIKTLVIKSKK